MGEKDSSDELQELFPLLPPLDEVAWGKGLDGTDVLINEVHIGASGKPERTQVGTPVTGPVWVGSINNPSVAKDWSTPSSLDELSAYQHRYYSVDFEPGGDSSDPDQPESHQQADLGQAHTWSSELVDAEGNRTGYHTVMLDIDHPVRVVPSSTKGHYHLYIDVPVNETDYFLLLDTLALAGVVEPGYVEASKARASTHLRLPWVDKEGGGTAGAHLAIPSELGEAIRQSKASDVTPAEDIFALAPGVDPEDTVDRAERERESDTGGVVLYRGGFVSEAEETARLSQLDSMRATLAGNAEGEITFDPAEYSVVYVDGKGVLRRSRR